jgi:hypothetical protein
MDSISNFVTAIVLMELFFNLHVLKSLIQWKNDHAEVLEECYRQFEMLNSLANMSYTTDFVFPTLNENFES